MLKALPCIWKVRSCPCQTPVPWNTSSFSQLLGLLTAHWVSTVSAGQCPRGLMEGEVEAGLCLEGLLWPSFASVSSAPITSSCGTNSFPVLCGRYRRQASGSLCARRLPDLSPCLPAVCGHQLAREWTARHRETRDTAHSEHRKTAEAWETPAYSLDTNTSEGYILFCTHLLLSAVTGDFLCICC